MARGDHIRVRRGLYWHHGIDCGDGTVIHYNGSPLRRRDATVARTPFQGFTRGLRFEVVRPCDDFDADEVLRRAKERLGESCYDLFSNNCEHFATWCTSGAPVSRQVEQVTRGAVAALALVCVAIGAVRHVARATLAAEE